MEKNNLEKLYQEKLKDFREIPDENVWESISASLDKKKKKRVIPIWWKLGGVAALLALLFYVVNPFEGTISNNQTTGIEKPTNEKLKDVNDIEKLSDDTNNNQSEGVVVEASENNENTVVEDVQLTTTDSNKKDAANSFGEKSKEVATNKVEKDRETDQEYIKEPITVAENQNLDKKELLTNNEVFVKDPLTNSETDALASSVVKEKANSNLEEDFEKKDAITVIDEEIKDEKKSIFEVIEAQKEEEVATAKGNNKWSVGPSIAPVYFDAIGQGSSIDSEFVQNSKSGSVNLSYGLDVAYNLGKRLKIRSGIHKVDYGYDTNEIAFSSTLSTSLNASSESSLDNINFSPAAANIIVESNKNNRNTLAERNVSDFSSANQIRDGRLAQQLGYLEVPLELNYTLVDKKFAVNLIGGVSSLFLVDNTVALESGDLVTEIGEANNVNAVNFSTNVGVGVSYEFSPKVQLNLEPIFKYQLNTFSETSGNFNPYSVGVYSGVRFNF